MKLSPHFQLVEMERSQTAARKGIDNGAPPEVVKNLRRLCAILLEPIREELGPMQISSGYRCPALNKAVGGSARSQHVYGLAADFNVPGKKPLQICRAITRLDVPYDQLIHEFQSWVHISIAATPGAERGMQLTIDRTGTRNGLYA